MCGTICSNDATLINGTTITLPASDLGSMRSMMRVSATMLVYSVPCAPETIATTGPGLDPLMTATRIESAESEPAGTEITP